MKGGKQPGAGRPKRLEPAIKPISWRPHSQAAKDKFYELGGARWLNRTLNEKLLDI